MPYLTFEEYNELGSSSIPEEDFLKFERKASDVLNSVTRSFYEFNDIERDVPFRRDRFKKAVAAQIDYFADMGATSAHALKSLQSVTIGRTSITAGNEQKSTITMSQDALMYLMPTGLLYRGVASC